ncbi:MAG: 5-methylcytosine-specific restriction enzyme subunit McrC [Thermoanaerobacteraceae bacterium]|jgi:5-methylcytosine-specific restriction enzyme subunit McrC|nr:5-methylcytosine-specific restriction enzyme subunit McrC [Thermoanaerobacteraceae bacterium]
MQVFNVVERGKTDIPIELIMDNGEFDIFPEVENKLYFNIVYRNKKLEVFAGKYIGIIPLNNRVVINVKPKVAIRNIIYIISKSGRPFSILEYFSRQYQRDSAYYDCIFDFLTDSFIKQLYVLEQQGIYRDYVKKIENGSTPKGKLLFKQTLMTNIVKNIDFKVIYSYFDLNKDILPNRLIKYTIWFLLRHYNLVKPSKKDFIQQLNRLYKLFNMVKFDPSVRRVSENIIEDIYRDLPKIREYYKKILKLSIFILTKSSISFLEEEEAEIIKLPSFIIDMEDVFEKYILNILKHGAKRINKEVIVYDGNTRKGQKNLFDDMPKPIANPDIVIIYNSKYYIIDVKYKDYPTRDDLNQIITYLCTYNSTYGILVLPNKQGEPQNNYLGSIGDKKLYIYRFNLDNITINDFIGEEESLIKFILDKISML